MTTETKTTPMQDILEIKCCFPDFDLSSKLHREAIERVEASYKDLLESCLKMLKLTGGSIYWNGDTKTVLEFMESAVEKATKGA